MTNNKMYTVWFSEPTNEYFINTENVPTDLRQVMYPLKPFHTLEEAEEFIAYPMNLENKQRLEESVAAARNNMKNYIFETYIKDTPGYKERLSKDVATLMSMAIGADAYKFDVEYQEMLDKYVKIKLGGKINKNYMIVRRELDHMFDMIEKARFSESIDQNGSYVFYFGLFLLNCYYAGAVEEAHILGDGLLHDTDFTMYYAIDVSKKSKCPFTNYGAYKRMDSIDNEEQPESIEEQPKPSIADAVDVIHEAFSNADNAETACEILEKTLGAVAEKAELLTEEDEKIAETISNLTKVDKDEVKEFLISDQEEELDRLTSFILEEEEPIMAINRSGIPEIELNIMDNPVEELSAKEMRLVVSKFKSAKDLEKISIIYRIPIEKVEAIIARWNSKFSSEEERNNRLIALWNEGASNAEIKDECHLITDVELNKIVKELGLGRKPTKPITVTPIYIDKNPQYQMVVDLFKENATFPEIRKKTGLSQHYINKVLDEAVRQGLIENRAKPKKERDVKTHTLTEISKVVKRPANEVKMYCEYHNINMMKQGRGYCVSDADLTRIVSGMTI